MNNNEYKIKCRAVFFGTISDYYGNMLPIDEYIIGNLMSFVKDNFFNYYKEFKLILYYKNSFEVFENEKTVNETLSFLKTITNENDLLKLYDDVGQNNVMLLSNLAYEFVCFQDSLFHANVPLIKQ